MSNMTGWEQKLREQIGLFLIDFIAEKNLEEINSWSEGMGALVDYQAEDFQLRILNDRDQFFLSLRPAGQKDFKSLTFVLEALGLETQGQAEWKDFEDLGYEAALLTQHWDDIAAAFAPANQSQTNAKFSELVAERTRAFVSSFSNTPAP